MVNLTINGTQIQAAKSATIFQAAEQAGINIPVMCYAKSCFPMVPAGSVWSKSSR